MISQPDLFTPVENTPEADLARIRAALADRCWHNRKQLSIALGMREDAIRHAMEVLGSEVVKGQRGFKLTRYITRDDLPFALQAAEAAISQGKKMIRYGIRLKTHLHTVIQ